jgi:uncharacterized membrane protein
MIGIMASRQTPRTQFILALLLTSLVSVALYIYSVWRDRSLDNDYLVVNLVLAWLPTVFGIRLITVLRRKLWSSWEALGLSLLWIIFLPNSFYMVSDYIHLQDVSQNDVLYDTIMFSSFIVTALLLGYASLYLIHLELRKRFTNRVAVSWIAISVFISSVAIYVGRDLRLDSWNVFTNPGGLLFDVSERLLHPATYPEMFLTIVSFFVFIMTLYNLLWHGARAFQQSTP